jgi:hypothetical protein
MTDCTIIGGAETPGARQAVTIESIGTDSAVVRQVWFEGGEQVERETLFASLGEALAYAGQLCRDDEDSLEDIELVDIE